MLKVVIADELAGKGKSDDAVLEMLKSRGYERYELDFTSEENERHVWNMPRIIEAVTNCDAVLFSERIEDAYPLYKVLYALADDLGKTCLYPCIEVASADYFERLTGLCFEACKNISDSQGLVPEGRVYAIWHETIKLLRYAEEMRDWLLANMPAGIPEEHEVEEGDVFCSPIVPDMPGCYVQLPSGLTEHFGNTDFDYERLMEMLKHFKEVTFNGDSELIRRVKDARSTKRS